MQEFWSPKHFCCSNALSKCFERSENASVRGSLAGATGSLVERACSGELAISSSDMKKNIFEYTANQMSAAERKKLFTGVRQALDWFIANSPSQSIWY